MFNARALPCAVTASPYYLSASRIRSDGLFRVVYLGTARSICVIIWHTDIMYRENQEKQASFRCKVFNILHK